jgi:hypothetical protein
LACAVRLRHFACFDWYSTQLTMHPSPDVSAARVGRWSAPRRKPMQRLRFHRLRRVAFAAQQRECASAARTAARQRSSCDRLSRWNHDPQHQLHSTQQVLASVMQQAVVAAAAKSARQHVGE